MQESKTCSLGDPDSSTWSQTNQDISRPQLELEWTHHHHHVEWTSWPSGSHPIITFLWTSWRSRQTTSSSPTILRESLHQTSPSSGSHSTTSHHHPSLPSFITTWPRPRPRPSLLLPNINKLCKFMSHKGGRQAFPKRSMSCVRHFFVLKLLTGLIK